MHDDLKRRLRDELDAELGTRPPRNLSDALTRGRRKRLALRLVNTMSMVVVGTALVAGGFSIGRELSSDEPLPPANPDADATVLDFPNLTTTFVSPRNGFSIEHPDRAALTPATQLWGFSKQVDDGFDVVETGLGAVFKGASTEWVEYLSDDGVLSEGANENEPIAPGGCGVPRNQQEEITIDGQPGRISECANRIEATVVFGGRLYLFSLSHDRSDARAVFDSFAATIDLTPETAVDVANLTTTFVSPTNGFSFKYLDRGEGSLWPATKPWDPDNQPPIDEAELDAFGAPHWDAFDVVETGLGAVFQAASTEIPDGVSVDEWVDAAVVKYLPAGCYVPRSQQAEITIDGQSGRMSGDCGREVATVVTDGRLYLFIAHADDRGWFDAWVDTIDLTPETAAVP